MSSKTLPQIVNFGNFVKFRQKNQYFRHDGHFSSFRQFFVKKKSFGALVTSYDYSSKPTVSLLIDESLSIIQRTRIDLFCTNSRANIKIAIVSRRWTRVWVK